MTPIPKQAQQVADLIRKKVKRPKELPKYYRRDGTSLRWGRKRVRWDYGLCACCPMGLLKNSFNPCPVSLENFGAWDDGLHPSGKAITSFYLWWDALKEKDAKRAVDAVWGKE